MSNNIEITLSSDSSKVIADLNKRNSALHGELKSWKDLATSGNKMVGVYRDVGNEMDRLRKVAASYKVPTALEQHQARLKEIRVLLRMGKIDAQQFNDAMNKSHHQHRDDSGAEYWRKRARLRDIAVDEEISKADELRVAEVKASEESTALTNQKWQERARLRDIAVHEEISKADELRVAEVKASEESWALTNQKWQERARLRDIAVHEEISKADELRVAEVKASEESTALTNQKWQERARLLDIAVHEEISKADELRVAEVKASEESTALTNQKWQERARLRDIAVDEEISKANELRVAERKASEEQNRSDREHWRARAKARDQQGHEEVENKRLKEKQRLQDNLRDTLKKLTTAQDTYNSSVSKYRELLSRGLISQQQFNSAVAKAREELEKSGKSMNVMDGGLKNIVTGWLSVRSAIALVGAEIDNLKSKQKSAADLQIEYGKQFIEVLKNYGKDSDPVAIKTTVKSISAQSGVPELAVLQTMNTALAARGNASVPVAVEAVTEALKMNQDPFAAASIASGFMTDKKNYPDKSMKAISGEQMMTKQLLPTVTDQAFAEYEAPYISMSKQFGNTKAQSVALKAAISQPMDDKEGRISTNAYLAVQTQLMELMPHLKDSESRLLALQTPEYSHIQRYLLGALAEEDPNDLANLDVKDAAGHKALNGRLGKRMKEKKDKNWKPNEADKSHLDGERKGFLPVVSLVRGEKQAWANYWNAKEQMPKTDAEAENIVDEFQRKKGMVPEIGLGMRDKRHQATVDQIQREDKTAQDSVTRERTMEMMKATGQSYIGQRLNSAQFNLDAWNRVDPTASAVNMMTGRKVDIRNSAIQQHRELSPQETTTIQGLDKFSRDLRQILIDRKDEEGLRSVAEWDEHMRPFNVNVEVNMPGNGQKPGAVNAAGLGAPMMGGGEF
jgi:hypothetical protein